MASDASYDPEGPGPEDDDLLDEGFSWDKDTLACPECGAPILADLGRCQACGHWLTARERRRHRPWWVWVLVAMAASAFLLLQIL